MAFWAEIKEQYGALRPGRRDFRNLGLVFLAALWVLAGLAWWRGSPGWSWLAGAGLGAGFWGLLWPSGLKPLYFAWMGLALILGWFVSRVLLSLIFYLVLTPIGLVLRLVGKDLLDMKPTDRTSHWHRREAGEYEPRSSEKMY